MTTIAFLGTGLMGTGFIRRARANGLTVRAWNRSAAKAQALATEDAAGVTACATVAEAVRGAERIHLSLADDASVDAVLEPLAGALPAGAWVVDHTTTAVRPTAERVARWTARGVRYVHAPVFMAPANCAEGTGWMLISGDPARHEALQPALKAMTGSLVYLGPQPDRLQAVRQPHAAGHSGCAGRRGPAGRSGGHRHERRVQPVRALQPRPSAAAARQAHLRRPVGSAVVRDVDGAQGSAADGGRGRAWRADAGDGAGVGEVVG
jgi:6-phosphogluconate dehydrogenase (decarboxylating)